MGSFVARAILCLIFGFFIYEIIRESNRFFGSTLNPYLAIVPGVLLLVLQEAGVRKWRANQKTVPMNTKINRIFYIMSWILLASLFLIVFTLWAGLIYKQIISEYSDYSTTIR
jgi:hypothetical protein